jgi:integrase
MKAPGMSLSDANCRSVKPSAILRKLSDGGGLQLWVLPSGSRLWRLAYRIGGKQKLLSFGAYPAVSLAEAREGREQAKRLLAKGEDPSKAKKDAKAKLAATGSTFRTMAEEFLALQRRNGRAGVTLAKTEWLLDFAYPTLGDMRIVDIRPPDVLDVLRKVENRGRFETARRLRSTIGRVFRFAVATGRAETDPTYALHGTLARPRAQPHAAVTDAKAFGALLRAIDGFEGQPTTLAALKLMALLFPRPGELRGAEWPEFDFDTAIWTIPASRTKLRRSHHVPLSTRAVSVLNSLRRITGDGRFLFPSVRTVKKPISENTLNAALRRLGYAKDEATSHGFRASASTLLNECGKWHADAIERQLAHIERNDVRRAYARGEHWDERVQMMQWWAEHLDTLKVVGKVIPIGSSGLMSTVRSSDREAV